MLRTCLWRAPEQNDCNQMKDAYKNDWWVIKHPETWGIQHRHQKFHLIPEPLCSATTESNPACHLCDILPQLQLSMNISLSTPLQFSLSRAKTRAPLFNI